MNGADMKKGMLFEAVAVLLLISLVFILYVMVMTGGPSEQWAISGVIGSPDGYAYGNILMGDNGTVYAIDGTNIRAIGPGGHVLWSLAIPNVLYGISVESWRGVRAATDNGTLYIVLEPADYTNRAEMLAISPVGKFLWGKAYSPGDIPADLSVNNGHLYVVYPGRVTVYNGNGTEIWHKSDVYHMPAIDENGTVYMIKGITDETILASDMNGGQVWNKNIRDYGLGGFSSYSFWQPLYNNHTIYMLLQDGFLALDQNGSLKWKKPSYGVTILGSFDSHDNLYLLDGSRIFYVSPDGSEHTITDSYNISNAIGIIDVVDDIMYTKQTVSALNNNVVEYPDYRNHRMLEEILYGIQPLWYKAPDNRALDQIDTVRINAYSIKSGELLWNYTMPLSKHSMTLSGANYRSIIGQYVDYGDIERDNLVTPEEWYRVRNVTGGAKLVNSLSYADLKQSGSVLYVNFWSYNYEVPTFFGLSKCTYAGGIYAFDKNGSMMWSRQPGSRITVMDERNGTVYYGTNDGRMFAAKVDAAAGFALTAAFYLFVRFFLAGAVTRARSRIASNENRNRVLKFIADNPGSSLYEVCRGLKMNKGTARYHLLILGINHRIASFKADDKYVRYFTNSGSYSADQQLIISIVKRDGVRKVLNALLERPGLSNVELATELGMQESATLRYIQELSERGVVTRDRSDEGRLSYSIKNEHKDTIVSAMGWLDDP